MTGGKKIDARLFKPITNRINAKPPVFNQEKASSAVTSGHFEMYFIFFLLISQLDSFLCDVLEGPYS